MKWPCGTLSANLFGMMLMLGVTFMVIVQHSMVRRLSDELQAFEIVF